MEHGEVCWASGSAAHRHELDDDALPVSDHLCPCLDALGADRRHFREPDLRTHPRPPDLGAHDLHLCVHLPVEEDLGVLVVEVVVLELDVEPEAGDAELREAVVARPSVLGGVSVGVVEVELGEQDVVAETHHDGVARLEGPLRAVGVGDRGREGVLGAGLVSLRVGAALVVGHAAQVDAGGAAGEVRVLKGDLQLLHTLDVVRLARGAAALPTRVRAVHNRAATAGFFGARRRTLVAALPRVLVRLYDGRCEGYRANTFRDDLLGLKIAALGHDVLIVGRVDVVVFRAGAVRVVFARAVESRREAVAPSILPRVHHAKRPLASRPRV
mmetsp:Transcript_22479/g.70503  ORF Transcript_22479/g.70503 Transcript_22479/m.70503 type:complete len:328 (-) Transcript_22479:206-1189(-)